jgi:hypothetical protein
MQQLQEVRSTSRRCARDCNFLAVTTSYQTVHFNRRITTRAVPEKRRNNRAIWPRAAPIRRLASKAWLVASSTIVILHLAPPPAGRSEDTRSFPPAACDAFHTSQSSTRRTAMPLYTATSTECYRAHHRPSRHTHRQHPLSQHAPKAPHSRHTLKHRRLV